MHEHGQLSKAPEIIVLDGHDGAGKTMLARLAAATLGGTYVKPFDSTLGDMIACVVRRTTLRTR